MSPLPGDWQLLEISSGNLVEIAQKAGKIPDLPPAPATEITPHSHGDHPHYVHAHVEGSTRKGASATCGRAARCVSKRIAALLVHCVCE